MFSVEIYYFVFAIGCSQGYENVALNKQTWQTNQYNQGDNRFHSSNGVDGLKTNLTAWGGQCVISADGHSTATWWVNLTSVYSIHDIKIYYRTGNKTWDSSNGFTARFLGFYVYVSNTTDRLKGHLCFHDTDYDNSTISAVANIPCPVHGQYVIYYNERLSNVTYPAGYSEMAHNELCEVEVNGCLAGSYGPNCSLPCPDNCGDGYCDVETGVCFWCKPGYHGPQCESECDPINYGQDCRHSCGACLGHKRCHHINGSCVKGCDAGFKGEFCKTECDPYTYGFDCMQNCSDSCENNTCNSFTGQCLGHGYFNDSSDVNSQVAVIGVIVAVLIALLVTLIVLLVLRRRHVLKGMDGKQQLKGTRHYKNGDGDNKDNDPSSSTPEKNKISKKTKDQNSLLNKNDVNAVEIDEDELIHAENPYGEMYTNYSISSDIPLSQLERIISEKSKDDNDGFQKEYATLPYGEIQKCDVGKRSENIPKIDIRPHFLMTIQE
ncbi:cell death abnormality protein 1-like [Saccostrea cucullata]|uniref:cell death abnormality protein 1-like n=1 Tax=Saccostrea cuccullata TaxID=36930 RepID=UPI002ED50BC2